MAWTRIDDKFLMNPKIQAAGVYGMALYLSGLIYCNTNLTDGYIPEVMLPALCGLAYQMPSKKVADILVDLNLWESVPGGYLVHDFLTFNKSKKEIELLNKTRANNGAKGGRVAKQTGKQNETDLLSKQPPIIPNTLIPLVPNPINSPLPPLPPQDFQLFADVFESVTGSEPKVLNSEIEAVQSILEAGGTPDDYRKALQGMQDKDYTISNMASALNWTLADIEKRKRPARVNNGRKPKTPDMGGYEVDRTSEVVIIDNGEAFDGELQF